MSEEGCHSTYFSFVGTTPSTASSKCSISEMPEILAGRYRLERLLGAGGMGVVYRARDLLHEQYGDPDPYIALKMLNEQLNEAPDASALLYSEFALTRRLHHPNVLRPYSFEVDPVHQRAFITMELMRGLTLDKLLCERPFGMSWQELRPVAVSLLDALVYAHSRGVLHGDIKPSNVMLGEEGVRLFDFGLGLADKGPWKNLANLNRKYLNAWTPGYAAPELLEGAPLSASVDVYGVACLLYELACGTPPFGRVPSTQARDARLERELKAPRNLPKRCWTALRSALGFDPEKRVIGMAQLRDALGRVSSWW
ncbi:MULTISPECIES: serine/threonine-protein kinase [Pseudomonas]|uniref:non-specific serine/threonine protein kinase n=1 Tax=Pseudomonas fluorescens (strain Q2-87) TaxID=1038922 RepID=J2E892_PSEFQ|nr:MULTISPECIES: serine/threonine-protein kinase [Pseudomonas]EJK99329.1 serine/threonine protein kinase Stk1 [Pseudomonas fluorescens Q2-87]